LHRPPCRHILLEEGLFAAGIRPAINPATSLTRLRDTRIPALQVLSCSSLISSLAALRSPRISLTPARALSLIVAISCGLQAAGASLRFTMAADSELQAGETKETALTPAAKVRCIRRSQNQS
jgi:hypothetical protein